MYLCDAHIIGQNTALVKEVLLILGTVAVTILEAESCRDGHHPAEGFWLIIAVGECMEPVQRSAGMRKLVSPKWQLSASMPRCGLALFIRLCCTL